MRLKEEQLMQMLSEAFDCGLEGSYELKEQAIREIIDSVRRAESETWAVYSIQELKKLHNGARIIHSQLGEGKMHIRFDNIRTVRFGKTIVNLEEDNWPWNEPIKILWDENNR
jgi:hypothetical protein